MFSGENTCQKVDGNNGRNNKPYLINAVSMMLAVFFC